MIRRSAVFVLTICAFTSTALAAHFSVMDGLDPAGIVHKKGSNNVTPPFSHAPSITSPTETLQNVVQALPIPDQTKQVIYKLIPPQTPVEKAVIQQGNETIVDIGKAGSDTVTILTKANSTIVTTVKKAGSDTVNTVVKAGNDVTVAYVKGWRDTASQAQKSFNDVVDAGKAIVTFSQEQTNAQYKEVGNAYRRARQGKVIDALWGSAVEPAQATDRNAFEAVQKSVVLNAVAEGAATIYGGPAGAAAYAAWYTYKSTGDATMALKAGALSIIESYAGGSIAHMPTGTMGEVLKKAAMTGAVAGIATAAAGGDENAVKNAFLKTGGAVLVQGASAQVNAYSPQAHDALEAVQCISARSVSCLSNTTYAQNAKGVLLYDKNGRPRLDPTVIDPKQYIGQWTGINPASFDGQKNAIITAVSEIPQTNSIPIDHNRWVVTWTLGKSPTLAYNQPSVVLTYVGSKPPFFLKKSYAKSIADQLSAKK